MITSTCAPGRAIAFAGRRLTLAFKCHYTEAAATATTLRNGNEPVHNKAMRLINDLNSHRGLFLDVLSANATRRDAKQYLARFKPPKSPALQVPRLSATQEERNACHRRDQDRLDRIGVNLGGLYAPARAIADSPQFIRQAVQESTLVAEQITMHVALVCLRAPQTLDAVTLEGLALTLSQLVKLDTRIVLILDLEHESHSAESGIEGLKSAFATQAERLSQAISRHSREAAQYVTGCLETNDAALGKIKVAIPRLLLQPLKRSVVTLIPALAYTTSGQIVRANVNNVMTALTRQLSNTADTTEAGRSAIQQTSLDRVIVLDEAGGIPSRDRAGAAHVSINLEQEYDEIATELAEYANTTVEVSAALYERHQANLGMVQQCLALLPPASSALVISPQEAASSSQGIPTDAAILGAGTRRQKNTLIHNLLTNKPIVSSSLPAARFSSGANGTGELAHSAAPTATLIKRGMPVSIVPAVTRGHGWQHPATGQTSLSLQSDPRVDFARLLHLIEDSFRRKLDVQHYLDRISGRIAGLIIAGKYEGAAILTWEQPPNTSDTSRLVPYLDKFAVLQSSQGSSGVADILFQAMVRSCFPNGVCWRSRQDNAVNKWYFERAASSWQIPGTPWTMFWTGEGVETDEERFQDYVSVCRNVVPSWVDGRRPD